MYNIYIYVQQHFYEQSPDGLDFKDPGYNFKTLLYKIYFYYKLTYHTLLILF